MGKAVNDHLIINVLESSPEWSVLYISAQRLTLTAECFIFKECAF